MGPPGSSRVLLRFQQPAEIRGVALLVWNHPDRASDLWLYTPALARHRRIAQQDRSARFAGTDLSFEDFEEPDTSVWEYSELQSDEENGEPCWRITARRKRPSRSQYEKYWLWISKARMTPLRVDKWRAGRVWRRLSMRSLELRQNIWTPMVVHIADPASSGLTILNFTQVEYNSPMAASDFTLEAMKGSW
jgi:hypothetical protein